MGTKERFYVDLMAIHPEVTGSCNLGTIHFPDNRIMKFGVDIGLFQEKKYEELNPTLPFNPEELEFLMVTHNHIDHIGRIPLAVRKGFNKKIYTTKDTSLLMPRALDDTGRILRDLGKRRNDVCFYSEDDIGKTISLLHPCQLFGQTVKVNDNVKLTFFRNGHLIGAAMILMQISYSGYEDINLFFTGDYNNKNTFFEVESLPTWVTKLPITIVQEATYGDMDSTDIKKVFRENVATCTRIGGTLVIPAFSLGRMQEVLYELKVMQDLSILDPNIPIRTDGRLGINYTNMYIKGMLDIKPEMLDFMPRNATFVNKVTRSEVLYNTNQQIIVTTSGMGSYGPAQVYIPEYIKRKNTLIHFTGYTAEGTLGRRLKDAGMNSVVEVAGLLVKKSAAVEYTNEFTGHAKADEMISQLKKFKNIKALLLNHGETETINTFSQRIIQEINPKYIGALGRGYVFRINPYGIVKTIPSEFK